MAFEKFTLTGRSFTPKATISKNGIIGFNEGARRLYNLEDFKFCVLYYDKEQNKIGIELTHDENAEGAIKIRFRPTGADISGKSFIGYYRIHNTKTTMYDMTQGETQNWIIVDLNTKQEGA